jgi:hypothetical protein
MRDQIAIGTGSREILVVGNYANPKKKMTHGIVRNISGNGAKIYLQWTEERDASGDVIDVTVSNGFPINDGETFSFELDRGNSQISGQVQALADGAATIAYVFE